MLVLIAPNLDPRYPDLMLVLTRGPDLDPTDITPDPPFQMAPRIPPSDHGPRSSTPDHGSQIQHISQHTDPALHPARHMARLIAHHIYHAGSSVTDYTQIQHTGSYVQDDTPDQHV